MESNAQKLVMGIILLTGFILAVSLASMYAQSLILSGTVCGCEFPVELLIPILSSAGLLVGCLVYYFLSAQFREQEKKDLSPILRLLDSSERKVIEILAKEGGTMTQSKIVSETGIGKVKISRTISGLEARGVVTKNPKGFTNEITLDVNLVRALQ